MKEHRTIFEALAKAKNDPEIEFKAEGEEWNTWREFTSVTRGFEWADVPGPFYSRKRKDSRAMLEKEILSLFQPVVYDKEESLHEALEKHWPKPVDYRKECGNCGKLLEMIIVEEMCTKCNC